MAGEKILIVDDEPDVLTLCARILESSGHQIEGVLGGREAIKVAGRDAFDLVLADIKMPGPDGLGTVETIREWTRTLSA